VNGLAGFKSPKLKRDLRLDLNSVIGSGTDKKSPGASSFSFIISKVGGLNSAFLLELSASERYRP